MSLISNSSVKTQSISIRWGCFGILKITDFKTDQEIAFRAIFAGNIEGFPLLKVLLATTVYFEFCIVCFLKLYNIAVNFLNWYKIVWDLEHKLISINISWIRCILSHLRYNFESWLWKLQMNNLVTRRSLFFQPYYQFCFGQEFFFLQKMCECAILIQTLQGTG